MRRHLGWALGTLTLAVALLHLELLDGAMTALRPPTSQALRMTPAAQVALVTAPPLPRQNLERPERAVTVAIALAVPPLPPGTSAASTVSPPSPPTSPAPPRASTGAAVVPAPADPAGHGVVPAERAATSARLITAPAERPLMPPSPAPARPLPGAPRDGTARPPGRLPQTLALAPILPEEAPPTGAPASASGSAPSEPASASEGVAEPPRIGPALPPAPAYRTRIPPPARIVYRLSRGLIVGTGELDWRPQAGGYQLRLDGKLPLIGTLITQTSRGRFDAAGLAPERHTDKRLRRGEQAASFQRPLGLVTFSGGAAALPIAPGLQDRLSVMLQLAAVAAAGPQPPPAGQELQIAVAGARGDSALWALRYEGVQPVETPDGPVRAWHYLRQPALPHDTRAEFWLDPARHFLPVRVRLTDGSGDPLELLLESTSP